MFRGGPHAFLHLGVLSSICQAAVVGQAIAASRLADSTSAASDSTSCAAARHGDNDAASLMQGFTSIETAARFVRPSHDVKNVALLELHTSIKETLSSISFDSVGLRLVKSEAPHAAAALSGAERCGLMVMCILMFSALGLNLVVKLDKFFIASLVVLWTIASTSMMIVNKMALKVLPLPLTLVAVQMVIAIFLILVLKGPRELLSEIYEHAEQAKRWTSLTVLFAAGLLTSMWALGLGSVPMLLVLRNLMPLVSLFAERVFLPSAASRPITLKAVIALTLLALGTVLYAYRYMEAGGSAHAVGWILLNIAIMVTYRLVERYMLWNMPRELSFGSLTFLQNLGGLFFVVILFFALGEHQTLLDHPYLFTIDYWRDPVAGVCICFSGIAGLALGYYSTSLQKEITATTMLALQSSAKVLVIFLAIVVLHESLGHGSAIAGCFVSLFGATWYAYIISQPAPALKEAPEGADQIKDAPEDKQIQQSVWSRFRQSLRLHQ